jgi:hypothetical protein
MNDLNDDLVEMFRRREGDVRTPAAAPTHLVARTRRREWLTVGVGIVAAVVVVVVSIAGLRSLGSSDGSQPGDVGPTAATTISGITITYPELWFAEDPVAIGIEPNDAPRTLPTLVLSLTRDDPQIQGVLGCPRLAHIDGQVLMTVQETPLVISGEASAPWPVPLRSVDLGSDEPGGCYEGWAFMRASWTAAGRSFEARVGFAPDASGADRSAMMGAFATMTFAPGSVAEGESVTLGSGTVSGDMWTLTATRDASGVSWNLQTDSAGYGSSADANPAAPSVGVSDMGRGLQLAVVILPKDVRSVALDAGGSVLGDFALFPIPAGWGDAQFAVIPLSGNGTGTVLFRDAHGNDAYPAESISWNASAVPSPSPTEAHALGELPWTNEGGVITSIGRFAGSDWKTEVLFYQDGVRLTIDGTAEDLGVLQLDDPIVRPLGADGFDALILVLTDTSVGRVSVSSEGTWDGRWMPASTGDAGEARLWVIEVPGAGRGTLLLDGQPSGDVHWPS